MKTKLHITSAFLASVTLLAPIISRADEPKPVTVKFEILKSGHISVPVKVNGLGPFRVGFDTGSPVTFLSTKIGNQLGLDKGGVGAGGGAMLGMMGMNFGGMGNVQFSVGDATAKDVPVMV